MVDVLPIALRVPCRYQVTAIIGHILDLYRRNVERVFRGEGSAFCILPMKR
jgi:hypothetical protein